MKPQINQDVIPHACLAPPLTDELLTTYQAMVSTIDDAEVKDGFQQCLSCCEAWWKLPESNLEGIKLNVTNHGTYEIKSLQSDHIVLLDSTTPWMRELKTLSNESATGVFDKLPNDDLRNAAFHLLWHAMELSLDREPCTNDKLKK